MCLSYQNTDHTAAFYNNQTLLLKTNCLKNTHVVLKDQTHRLI